MNIGQAIEAMMNDQKVARAGWNGKGMYIYLVCAEGFEPALYLHTAMGTEQPGWNASTPDILARDWAIC